MVTFHNQHEFTMMIIWSVRQSVLDLRDVVILVKYGTMFVNMSSYDVGSSSTSTCLGL